MWFNLRTPPVFEFPTPHSAFLDIGKEEGIKEIYLTADEVLEVDVRTKGFRCGCRSRANPLLAGFMKKADRWAWGLCPNYGGKLPRCIVQVFKEILND